jgi:hypothetical protein
MFLIVLHCGYLEFSVTNLQVIHDFGAYILIVSTYDTNNKKQVSNYRQHTEPCRLQYLNSF